MAVADDPNGVPAPPAEPATPVAPVEPPPAPSPGSEPVINPEGQSVPFTRFQEVNDKAKAAEERATQLEADLEAERAAKVIPPSGDDELDPEVVDLVSKSAKKLGFITQEELTQRETTAQVKQDVRELEATPPVVGIVYDHQAVIDHANKNNLPITSKNALIAAYRDLHWEQIIDAERNRALDDFKANGAGGGERPGSGGPTPPTEPEITGRNPRERIRDRISKARSKLPS